MRKRKIGELQLNYQKVSVTKLSVSQFIYSSFPSVQQEQHWNGTTSYDFIITPCSPLFYDDRSY